MPDPHATGSRAANWKPRPVPTEEAWLTDPRRAALTDYKKGRADEQLAILRNAQDWYECGQIDRDGYMAVMGSIMFSTKPLSEEALETLREKLRTRYPEEYGDA